MEFLLLWWLHESYGQRPNQHVRKMCSMLRLHLKVARCILWSTHRGMKFLHHGATEAVLAPGVVRIIYMQKMHGATAAVVAPWVVRAKA